MPRALALILGLLAVMPAQSAPSETLPAEITQVLKRHGLSAQGLGVYVHEVGQPDPVLTVGADVPRNPASTMKLLTTLVALEELGPAYTWKTEAYASAPVREGVLDGDLYKKVTAIRIWSSSTSGASCARCARAGSPRSAVTWSSTRVFSNP